LPNFSICAVSSPAAMYKAGKELKLEFSKLSPMLNLAPLRKLPMEDNGCSAYFKSTIRHQFFSFISTELVIRDSLRTENKLFSKLLDQS